MPANILAIKANMNGIDVKEIQLKTGPSPSLDQLNEYICETMNPQMLDTLRLKFPKTLKGIFQSA